MEPDDISVINIKTLLSNAITTTTTTKTVAMFNNVPLEDNTDGRPSVNNNYHAVVETRVGYVSVCG